MCYRSLMSDFDNKPLWNMRRPSRRRGQAGLLLLQAVLPVGFVHMATTDVSSPISKQTLLVMILFSVLLGVGVGLFLSAFDLKEPDELDRIFGRDVKYQKLARALVKLFVVAMVALPLGIICSKGPLPVTLVALLVYQLAVAWVCSQASDQLR